jgi:hypothetical protein
MFAAWRTHLASVIESVERIRTIRRGRDQLKAHHQRTFIALQYAKTHVGFRMDDPARFPGPFDIARHHAVLALIKRRLRYNLMGFPDQAGHDSVTEAELHEAVDAAYLAAETWHEERRQVLVDCLLTAEEQTTQNGQALVDLAVTFWKCGSCAPSRNQVDAHSLFSTDQLLAHRCHQRTLPGVKPIILFSEWGARIALDCRGGEDGFWAASPPDRDRPDLPVIPLDLSSVAEGPRHRWHVGLRGICFEFCTPALVKASKILESVGLDRGTTSMSDMSGARLVHENCQFSQGAVFAWDQAVSDRQFCVSPLN